jgi:hypothetical protein
MVVVNYAVEIYNGELLLTDFDSNYAEEGAKEVTQIALCSGLFLCDHF